MYNSLKQTVQTITMFFEQKSYTLNDFAGKYHINSRDHMDPYTQSSEHQLQVQIKDNKQINFCVDQTKIYTSGSTMHEQQNASFDIDQNKNYINWNGYLVLESTQIGLFGSNDKIAQVICKNDNKLTRHVYCDYLFKGPLGGYWFPTEKLTHVWHADCQ